MPPAYEILLLNTAIPQIQAAQSGDTYVVPRDIAINASASITGNLGIGAASAANRLEIVSAAASAQMTLNGSDGQYVGLFGGTASNGPGVFFLNTAPALRFGTGTTKTLGTFAELMRLDSSGNLGIGATNPVAKLDVYKTATVSTTDPVALNVPSIQARATTVSGKAMLQLTALSAGAAVAPAYIETGAVADYRSYMNLVYSADGSGAGYFAVSQFSPAGSSTTERMRITSGGDLLVGTTSTVGKVTINDGALAFSGNATAPATNVGIYRGGSADNLIFATGGSERARISSTGQITATSSLAANNLVSFTNSSATGYGISITVNNDSAGTYRYFEGFSSSATAQRIAIYTNGDVKNTNGVFAAFSDAKLKKDIVDAGSQWDDIKSLRVRKYRLKNDPEGVLQLGLIAQEVEMISPGLVNESQDETRDEEGKIVLTGEVTKGVKYSILYMKAVKALQEAMARIEQLEAKVASLGA